MADKNIVKTEKAARRRRRVRAKVLGTAERPRLTVAKSLKNTFAQIIDDGNRVTLVAAATDSKFLKEELETGLTKTQKAFKVGEALAKLAREKGVESVIFDRNVSRYHGRIKAVAEGARKGGLKF